MNTINGWFQVLSNLGIVVGLVLVAVQLNQDAKFNQSQLQNQHNVYRENQQIALGEDFAATQARLAKGNVDEITDQDLMLYHYFVNTYVSELIKLKNFAELGYIEESAYMWMATSSPVCALFDGDVGRTYLDVMGYQDELGKTIRNTLKTCRVNQESAGIKGNSFWAYYLQSMRTGISNKE